MNLLKSLLRALFGERPGATNIPDEWKNTRGRGVEVLVIDSGAPSHPALDGAIDYANSRSFYWSEETLSDIGDENGHATAVCGVIHAYAPDARIVCYKVAGQDGHGETTALRMALEEAARTRPDIVNVSLSLRSGASRMLHALGILQSHGIPVICGAGNDGEDGVGYPARFPQAIAVGACDEKGREAAFSSRGWQVDCLFPGVAVRTLGLHGAYAVSSGTSVACAAASGVAALWLSWLRGATDIGGEPRSVAGLIDDCRDALRETGRKA